MRGRRTLRGRRGKQPGAGSQARAVALLIAVLSVGTASGARGQTRDSVDLTLERALEVARGSNPTYRQAVNSTELNAVEWRTTLFDQVLPQVRLNLFSTGYDGNLRSRAIDNFGNPIENPEADWRYFSSTNQSLSVDWVIQGRSTFDALGRQRLRNLERDLGVTEAETALEIRVRRAFMRAVEQRELVRAEEELLANRETDQGVAERLFRIAMKTRVDVLNAELAVEQQALALQQRQHAFEQAKLTLRSALGDGDLPPLRLEAPDLPIFDPSSLDAGALVATALDVNPGLRQAEVSAEIADATLSESKRTWWPELRLGFDIYRTVRLDDTEGLFDVSYDEALDRNFAVGLSFPMFNNYFQNQQTIRRSRIDLDNARERRRQEGLDVEETVGRTLLELRNQHESLRLADRSHEIAAEALRLAREEYRLGARTFENLRQAFDQEADTRRQVIQARFAFVDALLTLEEAVGARVRPDGAEG